MVILFVEKNDILNEFARAMAVNRDDAVIIDVSQSNFLDKIRELDSCINSNTHVISFNNTGIGIGDESWNYWDKKKVQIHNILVDHPYAFSRSINRWNLARMRYYVIDYDHKKYMNRFYPDRNVSFLPHGGIKLDRTVPYDERAIQLLYVGTYFHVNDEGKYFENCPKEFRDVLHMGFELLKAHPRISIDQLIELIIPEFGLEDSDAVVFEFYDLMYRNLKTLIRGYYQCKIVEKLADSGIKVDVCGNNWESLNNRFPQYIRVHKPRSSRACLDIIANSKIVLNTQPWYKMGSHERVFNAMLNGAVSFSESTGYFESIFCHKEDIMFYQLDRLDDMAMEAREVLNDPDMAKYIISNAKRKVEHSTWEDRLIEIING